MGNGNTVYVTSSIPHYLLPTQALLNETSHISTLNNPLRLRLACAPGSIG
jgi:hypothetical protein